MWVLNILYFLIITFYGFKFLHTNVGTVKGALDAQERYEYSGVELFWTLTFSTGLLAFSANVGVDLMAIRLLVLELFCIAGLRIAQNKAIWSFPLGLYVVYLVWLLIGCFYGPSWGYGIRVILKYSYPLLLCLFASSVVRDQEVFLKSSLWARKVALISLIFSFVPWIGVLVPGVFWYGTARAINYISIMSLSLCLIFFTDEKRKNIIYTILFMLPCFIWVFRTSIMGSLVAIMAFSFIRYKLRSLPIIAGVLIAGVVAVFTIPSLREKMFLDSNVTIEQFREGKISEDDVNTNARRSMWEDLEKRFFEGHEVVGSGTGSVQNYMYNNFVFGGLKVAHSDFLQMRCDNGLIGLGLYIILTLCIYFHAFRVYWSTDQPCVQLCALVAGTSIAGVAVTLYSDNSVNYSMATLSMPYGFYGMMLGLRHQELA